MRRSARRNSTATVFAWSRLVICKLGWFKMLKPMQVFCYYGSLLYAHCHRNVFNIKLLRTTPVSGFYLVWQHVRHLSNEVVQKVTLHLMGPVNYSGLVQVLLLGVNAINICESGPGSPSFPVSAKIIRKMYWWVSSLSLVQKLHKNSKPMRTFSLRGDGCFSIHGRASHFPQPHLQLHLPAIATQLKS